MTEPHFHGDLLGPEPGRGPAMSGPVVIRIPEWATPDQARQFERWVQAANRNLAERQRGADGPA